MKRIRLAIMIFSALCDDRRVRAEHGRRTDAHSCGAHPNANGSAYRNAVAHAGSDSDALRAAILHHRAGIRRCIPARSCDD